jgi:hypothetical protein
MKNAVDNVDGADGAEGSALIVALLIALMVGAIGASLVTLTTTETLISASYRHTHEASYGAEAAFERTVHDLATLADWSLALKLPPEDVTASSLPRAPDGRTLDLGSLTARLQRDSDARDSERFGADSPRWRLYAHARLDDFVPPPPLAMPIYVVVWVADDGWDGDGNPETDANNTVVIRAEAFGSSGARRAVEGAVSRSADGGLRLRTWREVR